MIPFLDLKRQYESIRGEIDSAISRVFACGQFILGEEVKAFEHEFAEYCGVDYAVGVGSGTEALHLALMACDIGDGDEVITVSHTAVATVIAIEMAGARPVFVDIDPQRYTLDPSQLKIAITPRTKAIIPVHLYGCPADLSIGFHWLAWEQGLMVIEDCAQAHGATYMGQKVGSLGDIGCFSFYPTKNLGAYGDGGMVVTKDAELASRVRELRQYGWKERYVSQTKGICSRLDELQAAILRVKLRHLDEWNLQRQWIAHFYDEALGGVNQFTLPYKSMESKHVYHNYVVLTPKRDELRAFLQERGIGTLIHYPLAVHQQPAYRSIPPISLPHTEKVAKEVLSLPLYPELREEEVIEVCEAIKEWAKESR